MSDRVRLLCQFFKDDSACHFHHLKVPRKWHSVHLLACVQLIVMSLRLGSLLGGKHGFA